MTTHESPGANAPNSEGQEPQMRWSDRDLAAMETYFWREIAPTAATAGIDVAETKPTHAWLSDHGYRPFVAALRRHHDTSFGEFWENAVASDPISHGYDWATGDADTIDALEHFLDRRERRHGLSERSIQTLRYRLNTYVRAFAAANDHAALLASVTREGDTPAHEAVDEVFAAFDHLNETTDVADATIQRVASVVEAFYGHLVARRVAGVNPASGLDDEFKWNSGTGGVTPALAPEHVTALVRAAATSRERLLVVALAAWGLRAEEVAALHVDQFDRDTDDVPRIEFDERKNGPGSVSVLYGLDAFDDRLAEFSEREDWNGYLFPSRETAAAHVSRQTVWRWFRDLTARAGLPDEIEGERPSPQLCRRFWYDRYAEALDAVVDELEDVAAEQGSADPEVVMQNYLSADRARRLRRERMRANLATAFDHDH
jgi:site-specific recombinase XerD